MALLLFHSESRGRLIFYSFFATVLSFFLGGSNFTTALLTLLVLAAMTAVGFLCRNRRSFLLLLAALACAAGLSVSAAAPGNSIRKMNFTNTPSAAEAILRSFRAALNFLYEKTTLPVVVCMLFVLPILYKIARSAPLSFRRPPLVPAVTFCIFSAQFTPPLFALGFVGPTRLLNIIYYSYYPLLLINAFYLLGWLARKWGAGETAEAQLFSRFSAVASRNAVPVLLCFSIAFPAGCVGSNNVRKIAGISALLSLHNGQAAQYDAEADRRLAVYKDPSIRNVSAAAFSQKPYVLYFADIEPIKIIGGMSRSQSTMIRKRWSGRGLRAYPRIGDARPFPAVSAGTAIQDNTRRASDTGKLFFPMYRSARIADAVDVGPLVPVGCIDAGGADQDVLQVVPRRERGVRIREKGTATASTRAYRPAG